MNKQVKKTFYLKAGRGLTALLCLFSTWSLALQPALEITDKNSTIPWIIWRADEQLNVSYRTSKFKQLIEIKAQAKLKSSLAGFIYFIEDLDNITNWLDNAQSAEVISTISSQENIFITRFKSIWPIAAREVVVRSRYWQNKDLSLEIAVTDASHSIDTNHDVIRMRVLSSHWKIVPTKLGGINISYQFIVDPKGNIPKWLTKTITLNSIWTTLHNIQEQLPHPQWQQQKRLDIRESH